MAQENENVGPPSPTFLTLILKTFAGLGGGVIGTLLLLVIFLGASTILQSGWDPDVADSKNPLFIFVFMAMVFITSLVSNLCGSLFFSFVQPEKYTRRTTSMSQIFFVNLVIFVILAPVYILLDARNLLEMMGFLAIFHVEIAMLASVMVLEIVGNLRYALVGVYGVIFSMMISTVVLFAVFEFFGERPTPLLFSGLGILWVSLGFVSVVVEMLYRWIYVIYGRDFLMSQTEYGKDYGEEPEEAEPPPDVSGAEFLKK